MSDLILPTESFRRNARVNEALLAALTPPDLALGDGRGGWTVGEHLGHLAGFRLGWLSEISPPHTEELPHLGHADGQSVWHATGTLEEIGAALRAGDRAAMDAVQAALGENRSFIGAYSSHPAHFLQHIIVHDSHHRGQVMTLLRQGGRTPEQMDALDDHWAIWRE